MATALKNENYTNLWSTYKNEVYRNLGSLKGYYSKGKYRYKATCPFCGSGSKENKTSGFSIIDNTGSFKCYSCFKGGGKLELFEKFGIEYKQATYSREYTNEQLEEIKKANSEKERKSKIERDNRMYAMIFESYERPTEKLRELIDSNNFKTVKDSDFVYPETITYLRSLKFENQYKLNLSTISGLHKLKHLQIDTSTLKTFSELYKSSLVVINSFYGSGKTHKIINEIIDSNKPFIFVSVRVQLLRQVVSRCKSNNLECELYLDVKDSIGYNKYNSSICITPDSLHHLKHYDFSGFIVIFDECVTMLNKFDSFSIKQIGIIKQAISTSYSTFFLDKNFREFHLEYLTSIASCERRYVDGMYHYPIYLDVSSDTISPMDNMTDIREIGKLPVNDSYVSPIEYLRMCKHGKKRSITEYVYLETILNKIKTDIVNEKNIIVYCDRKKLSNEISEICKFNNVKYLLVNGDTSKNLDLSNIDSYIKENDIKVLIYTNSLSVGVSIEIERHFTKIYAIVQFLSNGKKESEIITGYEEIEQALHRYRNFNVPIHIYIKQINKTPITIEKLTSKVLSGDTIIRKFLETKYKRESVILQEFENEVQLYINQLHYKHLQLADTRNFCRTELKKLTDCYIISYDKTTFQLTKNKTDDLSTKLINTKLVDETTYKTIKTKLYNSIAISDIEQLQYEKYNLYGASGFTSEDQLNKHMENYSLINLRRVFGVISIKEELENNKLKKQEKVIGYNDQTNRGLQKLSLHEEVFNDIHEVNKTNAVDILIGKSDGVIATGYNLIDRLYGSIISSKENEIKRTKENKEELKEELKKIKLESTNNQKTVKEILTSYNINWTGFLVELIEKSGYLVTKKNIRKDGKFINNYIINICGT